MKEREYILELYELYNKLLTEREKTYFEDYYFEDLSLQEIADNNNVSKSYVGKFINIIINKLNKFEESLRINYKNKRIRELIKDLDKELVSKIEDLL